VIGSQALHASVAGELPPEASRSVEVDVAAMSNDAEGRMADLIDGSIGEASMFHATFGYYAQGVVETTAMLPGGWRERLVRVHGITPYDAGVLADSRALADYFEAVVRSGPRAKLAANWVATELLRLLNDAGKEIAASPVSPEAMAELLKLVESGQITVATGKKVFAKMFASGQPAGPIIAAEGLTQVSDAGAIEQWAREVIAANPENVAKYRSGNEGVFKFFVGQVMRLSRGQANPQVVNDTLKRLLAGKGG